MGAYAIETNQRIKVEVDLARMAQFFWEMDNDAQAEFFVEVAKLASDPSCEYGAGVGQAWHIGTSLMRMGDDARDAREMLHSLLATLEGQPYDWTPTVENVNALHPKLRAYVRDIEAKGAAELVREVEALKSESEKQKERIAYLEKTVAEQRERESRRASW